MTNLNLKPHNTFSWLTARTGKHLILLKESNYLSLLFDQKKKKKAQIASIKR